jgi:hypothetical protein
MSIVCNTNTEGSSKAATKPRRKSSGAMTQQRCDSGNVSSPQKFVQLVGYRDPKVRSESSAPPRAPRG